jgi:transcription elongation GreA/GreB family factor
MDKARLVKSIVERLTENLAVLQNAARASHAEATHESSKAENKYDTRGLEAAYLAGGQARQAREIVEAIKLYEKLVPKIFAPDEAIDMTALVELQLDGGRADYFIGPKGGGVEIMHQRKEVTVITPQSPLGQMLIGKQRGARWSSSDGSARKYQVISVR